MRFLVEHGADATPNTFEAETVGDAIHQAVMHIVQDTGLPPKLARHSITTVSQIVEIEGWQDAENQTLFAVSNDDSWFGAADLSLVLVPNDITDADKIEDFIVNNRGTE